MEKLTPQPQEATAFGFLTLNARPMKVVDEIEFGALQHLQRDGVDHNGGAVAGGDEIVLGALFVDVERILKARTAAAFDRYAQRRAGLCRPALDLAAAPHWR